MSPSPQSAGTTPDLGSLAAISDAVEAGLGLPEVVRAASRALESSLVLFDRSSAVLAVAVASSADETAMMERVSGVEELELRVGDEVVGRLRIRPRSGRPAPDVVVRLATTLIASEVERVRAPERASAAAQEAFISAALRRTVTDRDDIVARAAEVGIDLRQPFALAVVHAHRFASDADADWRNRVLTVAERGARAAAPGTIAASLETTNPAIVSKSSTQVVAIAPNADEQLVKRFADAIGRELHATLHGYAFTLGYSRVATDPVDLYRAGNEAILAANVAEARPHDEPVTVLAFEETGAYRILLPAMAEDPQELKRFYAETIEPLVAYDEQYDTNLVNTLETYLDADGNVAGTAQRLFTHRHTIRYRLERVRELTGLDVSSTDGREKLGLGLKAMRVLGIAAPRGPAAERGAEGGRVPRGAKER